MAVEQITDANFATVINEAKAAGMPVLIDFWAPWCGPCRAMAPVLDELAQEYDKRVRICKMNVDENPQTAQAYGVRAIPTMVLIKGGDTIEQITGAVPKDALKRVLSIKGLDEQAF